MNVCVVGLWHLGSVTAACLAAMGHRVIGLDPDRKTVDGLAAGQPPVYEPGLAEAVSRGLASGSLSFTTDPAAAVRSAEVVWVTYDTPVDDDDVADVDTVISAVTELFPALRSDAVVLISSQLVAGCTASLRGAWQRKHPGTSVEFAYSPENLRLGKAIQVWNDPERIIVGVASDRAKQVITQLLAPLADRILWMSVESAEMTKHALNAFLALSVTFANEIASICEQVGADAKEVERGLKSERRIGPGAYLAPGAAFAGGTLARDVQYLKALAARHARPAALLTAIKDSNDRHRSWAKHKLEQCVGELAGKTIAVLGLTYKPDTDTLRRSDSIELCGWLLTRGARVVAHDPRVPANAPGLPRGLELKTAALDALDRADALVIGTAWPEYQNLQAEEVAQRMASPRVIDAARYTAKQLNRSPLAYYSVGTPSTHSA
jgi:UDPglucose 6-dehydrogenase